MSAANVLIGGNVVMRAAWLGGPSQYSLYVYSGTSSSCGSDTNNVATYHYPSASYYYITVYPTASGYYCYKAVDSASNYAYSQAMYVYVINPTTTTTTTTIPTSSLSNLVIRLASGTMSNSTRMIYASWTGGIGPYTVNVFGGTSTSCMADTNQVNSFISTYNTVAFSVLSSAFYCFSLFDSIGDYAYSPTIYANSISISTTTTIPTNTVTSSITSSSTTTKPTTSTTIQYTTTIPSNTIANHTSSTSITTTIQAIPLSNLTISMVSGVTATSTGGSATIRASWFGNARPFRMYVFSGSSTACGSDTRPVTYLSFNASPAYFPVYPNASAYYCYKLMDAAGSLSYSLTQYINVPYICAPPSVYNATTMGCWSPRVAVSVSNSSQAAIQNISSSIGISANALIALSTTPNSVVVNCNGCNGAVNNTQGITTISAAGNIPSRANTLSTNTTLLNQFVTNSTPKGFSIINSTIMSSNQTNGTANGVVISWNSSSAVGSQNISVATIRKITANQSSITPAQLGAQYVLNYMPNVSSISVTTHTDIHASAVIHGNTGTTHYVPSTVTVYSSKRNSAVISVTNLVRNSSNYVNTTSAKRISLNSMVLVPSRNITALAAGITVYNSVSASNTITSAIASNTNLGNVIGVIVINSSVNDSLIKAVQYRFNVSKRLLTMGGVSPQSVRLYRQNITAARWIALPTNLTGSNATQYFYSATSPGLSIYAIGFGYLETNITETNTTSLLPKIPSQKSIIDPLTLVAILLFVVALVIVYLTLFRRESNPPEYSVPQSNPPKTTEDAINNYIDQESR